jgi:hypothetical protein
MQTIPRRNPNAGKSTVGSGSAAFDPCDQDKPDRWIEVVENTIVAETAAPTEAVAFEPLDVAGVRIDAHLLEGGDYPYPVVIWQTVELLSCLCCEFEAEVH